MFFGISKVVWFLLAPSHIAVWLALAAAILMWRKRPRWALRCAVASAAVLIACGFTPLGVWLMHPVENAYTRPVLPAHIDGILILGGGTDGDIAAARGVPNGDYGMTRLVAAYRLARAYPQARVVFSGGPFDLSDPTSEAGNARKTLTGLGLSPQRIVLEPLSRNTWENFIFTRALVKPKPGETWVLVTSAFHMPRAIAIAKRVQWPMLPWPSDYMTSRGMEYNWIDLPHNLQRTDMAVHEGIGMLAYRLSGKAG